MPRYPTVGLSATREMTAMLLDGGTPAIDEGVVYVGREDDVVVDLNLLEMLGDVVEVRIETFLLESSGEPDRDTLEGALAVELYKALDPARVPLRMLDDPGFWRFVTLRHFWPFVVWREPALDSGAEWATIARYVDGRLASECVTLRMFVRASVASESGHLALAEAVPRGTDFWRSHLIRVGTGSVPPLAGALIKEQAAARLAANPLRVVARKINWTRTNVLMYEYTADEAEEFVKGIW